MTAVSGGYVVALSLVCLLQYIVHLHSVRRAKTQERWYRAQLESEMNNARRERTLAHLESSILRDFVIQSDFGTAVGLLFRRFVPDPRAGFAALLRKSGPSLHVTHSWGLSDQSRRELTVDETLIGRLEAEQLVSFSEIDLHRCGLMNQLPRADRDKVRELYLFALCDKSGLQAVLVTTSLYPPTSPLEHRVELAERLMLSVAAHLKQTAVLEQHRDELEATQHMLGLRAIADRPFESPVKMVEAFLSQLTDRVEADRAVLCVKSPNGTAGSRVLVRCGTPLQAGVESRWQAHENRLAESVAADDGLQHFGPKELDLIGINSLVGGAVVVPLSKNGESRSVLCLTRRQRSPFDESKQVLIRWAAEFLAETMLRAFNQAAVERRARQDGLTELANRRTFEEQIHREIQPAKGVRSNCSLLLCDLDRFKSINDRFGHQAGDEALRVTAKILRNEVAKIRTGDRALIARYGGEEMAILLPGVGLQGATRIAEAIRAAIERTPMEFGSHRFSVTTSVGIASYPAHAATVEDLIAAADAALYHAKEAGRNRICSVAEALV